MRGGEADDVPLDEVVGLKSVGAEVGLLLLVVLLPVSIVAELLADEVPLDRHIALSHDHEHASVKENNQVWLNSR